jgi:hypothetical protein
MATAAVASSSTTLTSLLKVDGTTYADVSAHLDALDAEARVREVRELPGRFQSRLWKLCEAAPPLGLEDIVPASAPDGKTFIFAGKNSLPMFTWFEKRFARQGGQVIGYNHQSMSFFTGPGYFTLAPATAEGRRGEVLFDYTRVPEGAPEGWPAVKPNSAGFSKLVYNDLHDYCRRVSRDVVLGEATRLGKPMNSYFLLARR